MKNKESSQTILQIVYDKTTGRILQTHRSFNVDEEAYYEVDAKDLLQLAKRDEFTINKTANCDASNLSVISILETEENPFLSASYMFVDKKRKTVVEKPKLQITANKTELQGDGKDTCTINIKVVDSKGNLVTGYNGEVKVTTSRGKLSAKGGRVNVKMGTGEVSLISVNETVDQVKIDVWAVDGRASKSGLDLEFL